MGGGDDEGWGDMDMDITVSYPDSQLVLINVWEELVLKKWAGGSVVLFKSRVFEREATAPRQENPGWLVDLGMSKKLCWADVKIVQGR